MKQRHTLLFVLLLPLLGLVTLTVGSVWFFSVQSSQSSIQRLLEALSSQKISEIRHKLDTHFSALRLLNEGNAHLLTTGLINPDHADAVQQLFWRQAHHYGNLGYLLLGKQDGDFVDVGVPLTHNLPLITERISHKQFGDTMLRSYGIDDRGQRQDLLGKPMEYPFQKERWFSDSADRQETFWTEIYSWESATANPQAIAVSSPVFNQNAEWLGAVAIEYRLDQLDRLLRELTADSSVSVFLMDDRNNLIASSVGKSRSSPSDLYLHPKIRSQLETLDGDAIVSVWHMAWQGERYHVGAGSWAGNEEWNWMILVAVPEDIFLQELIQNRRYAIAITLAAWVLLIVFGTFLHFRMVHRPLNQLVTAVQRAESGDLEQNIKPNGVSEFYFLAEAFNGMFRSLRSLYASLAHANEDLERQVKERTRELERLKDLAEQQARTDPLTGLANRRAFHDVGDRLLQQTKRSTQPLSLIMLDIDHFKRVNDTWGHDAGDLVLQVIAGVLGQNARGSDLAARMGGEEFAILLAGTGLEGARAFAERLRLAIMELEISAAGEILRVTASFGVAEAQMPQPSISALLTSADAALYRSKSCGRNRVTVDDSRADRPC